MTKPLKTYSSKNATSSHEVLDRHGNCDRDHKWVGYKSHSEKKHK